MKNVNFVLAVGSVDGACTAAAVLRNAHPHADIQFCQAFTVDKLNPYAWGDQKTVLFVDLAVNNSNPEMTVDLLRRVKDAGHTIYGVLDEHNAEDWYQAFNKAGIPFDDLIIKPVSQENSNVKSSGALLLSVLGNEIDEQTRQLCNAADAGDRMDFTTHFGGIVNQAVKSKITDDSRRVYLAKHLAKHQDADEKILSWIAEYEIILATHQEVMEAKIELGDRIVRINTVSKIIDMTTLMKEVYTLGYDVVVIEGEMFDKAASAKTRQIAFWCRPGLKLDVVATLEAASVSCSGFSTKANVRPQDEQAALVAVRQALLLIS